MDEEECEVDEVALAGEDACWVCHFAFFPPILVWLLGCSVWTLEEDVRSEQLVVVFHTGEFGRARAVRPRIQSELS